MNFIIVFAVAIGAACANPQGFLQNTPDVQAATENFLNEYNRLAQLAAEAPDIDIYHNGNRLQRVESNVQQRTRAPSPINSGFNSYSFSADFGSNSKFMPSQMQRFPQVAQHAPIQRAAPVHRPAPVHKAAPVHRFAPVYRPAPVQRSPQLQHRVPQQTFAQLPTNIQEAPIIKWTGPMAHTVGAGVEGPVQDVMATPEVAAARNAHYRILVDAYQTAAAHRQPIMG